MRGHYGERGVLVRRRRLTELSATILIVLLLACGGGTDTPATPTSPVADRLAFDSGSTAIRGLITTSVSVKAFGVRNEPLSGISVTWSSTDPSTVSVSGSSTTGTLTALRRGSATIRASSGSAFATLGVTVVADVQGVTIVPAILAVVEGTTDSVRVSVTRDAGVPETVTWSSALPSVATVNANGVVTAVAPGTTVISATSTYDASKVGTVAVTVSRGVTTSVSVSLPVSTLVERQTTQATAIARSAQNVALAGRAVSTWTTSNSAVASVNASGLVTAVAPGTATISATVEGVTGTSAGLTVTLIPVATVSVTITPNPVAANLTAQVAVVARDAQNNVLVGRTINGWTSSNPTVATVSVPGVVTALAPGSASISCTVDGVAGTAQLTVTPSVVATVVVTLNSLFLSEGETTQATTTAKDSAGNVLSGLPVTWSSSNPVVATVSATGVVTALQQGSATIRATIQDKTGVSGAITVRRVPTASVAVALAQNPIPKLGTTQATAVAKDAVGRTLDARVVSSWSSTNTAVATVSSVGLVTAISEGTATISATMDGVTGAAPLLTVSPALVATVSVTAPSTILLGSTGQASAVPRDAAGAALTGRTVSSWSSSTPAVATIDASGLISSVAVGTTKISATVEGKSGTSGNVAVTLDALQIVGVRSTATGIPVSLSSIVGFIDVDVRIPFVAARPDSVRVRLGNLTVGVERNVPSTCNANCTVVVPGINTAAYSVGSGTATPQILNGASSLVADVFSQGNATRTAASVAIAVANADGFHVILKPPATSATSASGQLWYGGPSSVVDVQAIPVMYSGQNIGSVTMRFGAGASVVTSSAPFTASFGTSTTPSYLGYQSAGGVVEGVGLVSATYSSGGAAPTTTLNSAASIRVDFAPPTALFALTGGATTTRWIGSLYNFSGGYSSSDAGVGMPASTNRTFQYSGCGSTTFVSFAPSPHNVPECGANLTNGAYSARVIESDRLQNQVTVSLSGATFGVDVTAPSVQFTAGSIADNTIWDPISVPPSPIFDVTSSDTRSGLGPTAVERSLMFYKPASGPPRCEVGGGSPGSTPVTNPACGFSAGSSGAVSLPSTEQSGWMTYRVRVTDVAGNVSATLMRKALIEGFTPTVSSLSAPSPPRSPTPITISLNMGDDLELREAGVIFVQPALGGLLSSPYIGYPIVQAGVIPSLPFDDSFATTITSFRTPTGFAGWVEPVSALDSVQAPAAYGGSAALTSDIKPRGSDHGQHESAFGSGGPFSSLPTYQSWFDWNAANTARRVLTFRGFPSLSYAGSQGLKAEVATPLGTTASPFHRIDWYMSDFWEPLNGGTVMCYLGSSYNGGTGITVGNTTVWRYSQNVTPVIGPSCSSIRKVGVAPGIFVLPIGVRATMEGLAARPFAVVP